MRYTQCKYNTYKIYKHSCLYRVVMLTYNTEQYTDIAFNNDYTLPSHVLSAITNLAEALNINISIPPITVVKSPTNATRPVRRPKNSRDVNSEWKKDEPFKSTEAIQYVGFDKKLSEIRNGLNKLSTKNYDTIRESIYEHINTIIIGENEEILSDDNKWQLVNCIFDIASNNGFYAELYAGLYKDLIHKYALFEDTAEKGLERYINSVNAIRYEDYDVNYDLHCAINKENDNRKSLLSFIITLIRNDVLPKTNINTLLDHLDGLIMSNINNQSQLFINNELIENYFVLITKTVPDIFTLDTWPSVYEKINTYTTYNTKDYAGLSSRAKFKMMDIKELVSKKLSA